MLNYALFEGINNRALGWINQGFVDVAGCLVSEHIPIDFDYAFGMNRLQFMDMMESNLFIYEANSSYNWNNTFMVEILPWSSGSSLDNFYSGILVRLYKNFGGYSFMKGFYNALPGLVVRAPSSPTDVGKARDNFFIAASIGAKTNLTNFFMSTLRWPISQSAIDYYNNNPGIPTSI